MIDCVEQCFSFVRIHHLYIWPELFFHNAVTGPWGRSTIAGQRKVTYLLVIDPDKYRSICWKWHFCCWLVYNRPISRYTVTAEKTFQFTLSKTYTITRRQQIIYCVTSTSFPTLPLYKSKSEREKCHRRQFHSMREIWSFTCKQPLTEI